MRRRALVSGAVVALTMFIQAGGLVPTVPVTPSPLSLPIVSGHSLAQFERVPLNDLGTALYLGQFQGGLYENGSNAIPVDHGLALSARASLITKRSPTGTPSPGGRIVIISVGMSNTTQEWCSGANEPRHSYIPRYWAGIAPSPSKTCRTWTFGGQAWADPTIDRTLALVDCAQPGKDARVWAGAVQDPVDPWVECGNRLTTVGLSKLQVQAAWIKLTDKGPSIGLPTPGADAYQFLTYLGTVVRKAKSEYPNLQIALVSSRTYGGYTTAMISPEPYAYEGGISVKWLIQAQVTQARGGPTDPLAGSLDYRVRIAPVLVWGPYLWADGMTPRSDGLFWTREDFESDGTHPTMSGEYKVGSLLLAHVKVAPYLRCWMVGGESCLTLQTRVSH